MLLSLLKQTTCFGLCTWPSSGHKICNWGDCTVGITNKIVWIIKQYICIITCRLISISQSCFHVIFPGFRLLMCAIGKLNDNEISLNFRYIYPIFIHSIWFMIQTVQSPQTYILWPEDGPVQRPKHVVFLNKVNNIRQLFILILTNLMH